MSLQKDKLEYLKALQAKADLIEGLPFLYRWPWYSWARKFFESTNRLNFLTAGNQLGKSSTQIRKCIDWATDKSKWTRLWAREPQQFWYLYPSLTVATVEYHEKWVTENLPQGKYKKDPVYGWEAEFKAGNIFAIHFNSGVSVYFKAYSMNPQNLQSGSVSAIFLDEELPENLFEELMFRLTATNGYFHMVFTATLGQDKWKRVMECRGDEELLPEAFKMQVSLYDCLTYEDGTRSHWTEERIEREKSLCRSSAEIQKRIYGRFSVDSGLKYPGFDVTRNVSSEHFLPKDWRIYTGVDIGSGGEKGHPAAITFVAVNPTYTQGRIFLGWRGDGVETTASDVLAKYQEIRGTLVPIAQYFDWHSKDFGVIASRVGESFQPADKSHEKGEQILNTLFKLGALKIQNRPELQGLISELTSLLVTTRKNEAKDDFIDSLRYAVSQIPWNFEEIVPDHNPQPGAPYQKTEIDLRREFVLSSQEQDVWGVEKELEEWQELIDA